MFFYTSQHPFTLSSVSDIENGAAGTAGGINAGLTESGVTIYGETMYLDSYLYSQTISDDTDSPYIIDAYLSKTWASTASTESTQLAGSSNSSANGSYTETGVPGATTSSRRYTLTSTTSTVFSQTFASIGPSSAQTLISGTASATKLDTSTYTTSASQTGTAYLFGSGIKVQLYNADRGLLPPLRPVGGAFAITDPATANGLFAASSFTGNLSVASARYSTGNYIDDGETIQGNSTNGYTTLQNSSTAHRVTLTNFTSEQFLTGQPQALRKIYSVEAYLSTDMSGGPYSYTNISPNELTSEMNFWAPVFGGISAPRVFTSVFSGFSVSGASASAQWIYQSSSWRLRLTTQDTSTSGTFLATLSLSGSPGTTIDQASTTVGNTTAILGPLIPATKDSLNRISVTLAASLDSAPFYQWQITGGTAYSETSSYFSASTSQTQELGTAAADWVAATYANSELKAYKKLVAVSLRTATATNEGPNQSISIPFSVWQHSKWNEVGRTDAVSVNQ